MKQSARDLFRPHSEPALTIYDAFVAEAAHRQRRDGTSWILAERQAVHAAAVQAAESHGLRAPTLAEVEAAEQSAMGHCDYGAKWAYRIVDAMHQPRSCFR